VFEEVTMKKPFNRNNKENDQPKVWRTRQDGLEKPADWQLKLRAIGECLGKAEGDELNKMIENRYQDLWHRYNPKGK